MVGAANRLRRGFSILEATIALSLLAVCFFMILPLFHYALGYSKQAERASLAAAIARSHLTQVRNWAAIGYNYDTLSSYPGAAGTDPEHPEFTYTVDVATFTGLTPCASFEQAHPDADRRKILTSLKQVEILVRWDGGGVSRELRLVSLVGEPMRRFRSTNPVVVSGTIPGLLNHDDQISFTAIGYDGQDRPIRDLMFDWSVWPASGTGTLVSQTRTGSNATFTNRALKANGTPFYTGGSCQVVARAVYRGEERWGLSGAIPLQP